MRKQQLDGEQVFVIHEFLMPEECERYIWVTEKRGYSAAPITTAAGPIMASEVRNNERVMIDDPIWAGELWERARAFIPDPLDDATPVGLNERFRFYKYEPGMMFRPHTDGWFARSRVERSRLTFMVYLSGGCEGGETVIYFDDDGLTYADGESVRVVPEPGKALVFRHELLHEGAAVRAGVKYVLRTDVMYRHAGSD